MRDRRHGQGVDPGTLQIEFLGTMAHFKALEPSDVTTFVTGTKAWEQYGEEQVVEKPEYDPVPGEQVEGSSVPGFEPVGTSDVIPGGDVEIGRGYPVHAGSHEFGRVHGVVTDPGHQVTHVLLGSWDERVYAIQKSDPGTYDWMYRTDAEVTARPAYRSPQQAYVASMDGTPVLLVPPPAVAPRT